MSSRSPSVLLSGEEERQIIGVAGALLARIDARLRHRLVGVSTEQRFQWSILKAAVGDSENVHRLLRGTSRADDPRFPSEAIKAVLSLVS